MTRRKLVAAIIMLLLSMSYILWYNCEGNKDLYRRNLFDQVQKGMDSNQAISILSVPDTVYYNEDSSFEFQYFGEYYEEGLKSDMPGVLFDSLGKVEYADFGD